MPSYGKPDTIIQVDSIQRDMKGQLDQAWLEQQRPAQAPQDKPQGETETVLQGLCADVLGLSEGTPQEGWTEVSGFRGPTPGRQMQCSS